MITPRRIRLLRTPNLAGYRSTLADLTRDLDASSAADTFILVPTRAAATQLTRALDDRLPDRGVRAHCGSRADLYDLLIARLPQALRLLTGFEREALLAAGAREAEEGGAPPPFHVRPALIAEMLTLYDHLRRLGRSVDDFDRLLSGELEPAAESDRGAAQLLDQTRFLSAAFRAYEERMHDGDAVDEHGARAKLIATPSTRPIRHVIVAIGDRPFDPDGYWPADVTMLTTIAGLETIDIVSTSNVLDAGYLDRVQLAFIEIETDRETIERPAVAALSPRPHSPSEPSLVVAGDEPAFSYRDREDELEAVARRIKADRRRGVKTPLDRIGLVVARPLPYLYLAREVFGGAGIPYEALDTLPLAAEPYAAAVDVVLECAAANFTRRALMALLKSPHFTFQSDGKEIDRTSVAALDVAMAEQRYLGGLDRLRALSEGWTKIERPAAQAALDAARTLAPLLESRPMVDQVELLQAFLDAHDREHDDRRRRARSAVVLALQGLIAAYRRHDPSASGTVTEVSAAIRRWLGTQTFEVATTPGGIRILDAQSARFADLEDVQILGLVEGEWPERQRRNVFYPRSLVAQLEPARPERIALNEERDHVRAARAMFRDLTGLASNRMRLSTFALESESVVEPSSFIDDVPSFGLRTERAMPEDDARVFNYEVLADDPLVTGSRWAQARAAGGQRDPRRFQGEAGDWVLPRVSVSRLERYMKCPFQFYVANVLQVTEQPEDEVSRSPLERGRFLHELFETFFHEWQARGRGRITAELMGDARVLFEEIAGPALRSLPPAEAGLERARLFGSAVGSGIVDRVFAMEAERGSGIRERLMEYELDGAFTFNGEDGAVREVRLRAKIDRVDLLDDGTFRLIDYKTKYVPDRRQALQLPIYSACVRASLVKTHGRDIRPSEAMYLSFEGPQAVVPLEERGKLFEDLTTSAGYRLVAALDNIAAGHYPSRPETKNLCTMCAFIAVCRNAGGATDSADNTRATESTEGSEKNA
ncbi:MAG TPA: PD-(D/E)XK nuclease family protein [Vicinamibacterales bacterium]|nr:PD-(D/E)XK nuclease family protein [Vicinamibacterales bacterium]